MTLDVFDSILKFLSEHSERTSSMEVIMNHVNSGSTNKMTRLQVTLSVEHLIEEGLVLSYRQETSIMNEGAPTFAYIGDLMVYYISYKGYEVHKRGGYQNLLNIRMEENRFNKEKMDLELKSIHINNQTNETIKNNLPIQIRQGWLTSIFAAVSFIFIIISTVLAFTDNSAKELNGIKTVLEKQTEENKKLKESVEKLFKAQTKPDIARLKTDTAGKR